MLLSHTTRTVLRLLGFNNHPNPPLVLLSLPLPLPLHSFGGLRPPHSPRSR